MEYKPEVKYDKDHDIMHIFLGSPINSFAEEESSGIYMHRNEDTNLLTEFTIMEYSKNRVKFICKYPEYEYLIKDYYAEYKPKDKILEPPIIKYDFNRDIMFIIIYEPDFSYYNDADFSCRTGYHGLKLYEFDNDDMMTIILNKLDEFIPGKFINRDIAVEYYQNNKLIYLLIQNYKNSKDLFLMLYPEYKDILDKFDKLHKGENIMNNETKKGPSFIPDVEVKEAEDLAVKELDKEPNQKTETEKTIIKGFLIRFFNNLKPVDEINIFTGRAITETIMKLDTYKHLIDFNEILKQLENNYNFHEYKETNNNYQIKVYLSKPQTYHLNLVVEINIDYPSLKIYLISVDGNSLIEDDIKLLKCNHKDSNGHSTIFKESYNAYKCKQCGAKFTVDSMYYLCKGE
jgi:hypothetical protein